MVAIAGMVIAVLVVVFGLVVVMVESASISFYLRMRTGTLPGGDKPGHDARER
jgi:hypothetical protein